MKKTIPEKNTPRTPTKPIPQDVLRLIRKKDREKMQRGEPPRHPCPEADQLITSNPDGERSSGNYITPRAPNPDDL